MPSTGSGWNRSRRGGVIVGIVMVVASSCLCWCLWRRVRRRLEGRTPRTWPAPVVRERAALDSRERCRAPAPASWRSTQRGDRLGVARTGRPAESARCRQRRGPTSHGPRRPWTGARGVGARGRAGCGRGIDRRPLSSGIEQDDIYLVRHGATVATRVAVGSDVQPAADERSVWVKSFSNAHHCTCAS